MSNRDGAWALVIGIVEPCPGGPGMGCDIWRIRAGPGGLFPSVCEDVVSPLVLHIAPRDVDAVALWDVEHG